MVQWRMRKSEAIELLGGSIPAVAEAVGVTYQAVDKWPDELTSKIADRVQAALWRKSQGISSSADPQPTAAQG